MISKIKYLTYRTINSIIKTIKISKEIKNNIVDFNDTVVILNTQISSDNLGDNIIMYYTRKVLDEILLNQKTIEIPTHIEATKEQIHEMINSKAVIVCGTNFLSPHMELQSVWKFNDKMINIKNLILMGVGWAGYSNPGIYSKKVYSTLLNNKYTHSVRDQFTLNMLKKSGVSNVLNTNCVTLWGLDKFCNEIPNIKSSKVIFAVTGYKNDKENDKYLIDLLKKEYKEVYFWPQGNTDFEYLNSFYNLKDISILERTLDSYNDLLTNNDIDYVGSRLHGGIHALQHKKRAIILAVDNRALEISKDTNIPVIKINEIKQKLKDKINSKWNVNIYLNNDNIKKWKETTKSLINNYEETNK